VPTLSAAVERGNPDELLRIVDALCERRSWEELLELKDRCLEAADRGKQLWGVAEHVDYRLALEAPPEWAGPVVVSGAGRFTIGPLTEVAASSHTWSEISPHLETGPARQVVAQERAIRGDAVDEAGGEIPLQLQPWEPAYPVATYHDRSAEFPPPDLPDLLEVELQTASEALEDPDSLEALEGLVTTWTTESNGRSESFAVSGSARSAVAAFGLTHARMVEIPFATAMAVMAWAGASGGAHGRRPGAAAGRFAAWWAVAMLTDSSWPPDPIDLGSSGVSLRWYAWSDLIPPTGWTLHLAVEDPTEGLGWAVSAVDAV
jgi:hypothetical protein